MIKLPSKIMSNLIIALFIILIFGIGLYVYNKDTKEICPERVSKTIEQRVRNASVKIHEVLGCDGLTRSDFIVKGGTPYLLEINTLPGLTQASLCPKEARAVGMTFSEFLDKQITLALAK